MTAISPTLALQNTDSIVMHTGGQTARDTKKMGELRANILEEALTIFGAVLTGSILLS